MTKILNNMKNFESELSNKKLQNALNEALKKIDKGLEIFTDVFPSHASENNVYFTTKNDGGWNQGFWTGILWIAYELTKNEKYKKAAQMQIPTYTKRITEKLGVAHHDMGFLYTPSCVAAYKLTGNEEAKITALMAADNLISRYHEKGEFIQAWGPLDEQSSYRLIIDCLLNIPLLYWASEVSGDSKYGEVAYKHYKSTANNIFRPDGSTYHTYYFDMQTGNPLRGVTHQGASNDSCWARGQAWGIYGVMLTHMYKHNPDAIIKAKNAADYFINHLPTDNVPYWDLSFLSGDEERDSSAAAIAACGLIELSHYSDNEDDKSYYLSAAKSMINSLIDNYLTKDIAESNGLLMHAVYGKPQNMGVDECNIWGDYFYMEALARLIKGCSFKGYW